MKSVKQPIATTEGAIQIALDSGLDKDSPILQRVQPVILEYMEGKYIWPDPPEKHDNPLGWYKWVPQTSAAILAQSDRFHPSLEDFWKLWAETVQVSFQSGKYDRRQKSKSLTSSWTAA